MYGGKNAVCKCGKQFVTRGRNHKYCSAVCWQSHNLDKYTGQYSKRKKRIGLESIDGGAKRS